MEFPGVGTLHYEPMDLQLKPFVVRKFKTWFRWVFPPAQIHTRTHTHTLTTTTTTTTTTRHHAQIYTHEHTHTHTHTAAAWFSWVQDFLFLASYSHRETEDGGIFPKLEFIFLWMCCVLSESVLREKLFVVKV